jgi:hypothetical protein
MAVSKYPAFVAPKKVHILAVAVAVAAELVEGLGQSRSGGSE